MKLKKISFNAKGSKKEGSYRIPFIWMKSYLLEKYDCVDNQIDDSIDLYFCKAGQGIANKIRQIKPNARIVLFKPHLEVSTHFDLFNLYKTFRSIIELIIEYVFRRKYNLYKKDIKASNILIADSRKLKLYFQVTTNKISYYFKLFEKIPLGKIKEKKSLISKSKITFLYHGGIKHYNENFPQLNKLLKFIAKDKKVDFVCISNLSDIKKYIRIKNVNTYYYEYQFELLIKYLKKADIGYVPNFLRPRIKILKKIHDLFNYLFYQLNLYSLTEKNSSNAGRAYLYAQFGVPFICHPTREVIADFSKIKNLEFPNNDDEALWILKKYLTEPLFYEDISESLLINAKNFDLQIETMNLMQYIKKIF